MSLIVEMVNRRTARSMSSAVSRVNCIEVSNRGFPEVIYVSPPACRNGSPGSRMPMLPCSSRVSQPVTPIRTRRTGDTNFLCTLRGDSPHPSKMTAFVRSWKGTAGDLVLLAVGWGMNGFLDNILSDMSSDVEGWESKALRLAMLVSSDCLGVLMKNMNIKIPLKFDYEKKEVCVVFRGNREGSVNISGITPESARVLGVPSSKCSADKQIMGRLFIVGEGVDPGLCDCRDCVELSMESLCNVLDKEDLLWVCTKTPKVESYTKKKGGQTRRWK